MKIKPFIGIFLIAALFIAGCVTSQGPSDTVYTQEGLLGDNEVKDNTFKTTEEYQSFVKDHSSDSYGGFFSAFRGGVMMEKALSSADMAESAPVATGASQEEGDGVDFSGTNNQVEGVDEADMLKTDGEYIYTITEKTVFIVKAYPGEDAEVVSTIKFEEDYPAALFIDGDKLAVIGTVSNFKFLKERGFSRDQGYVFVNIYDISDKEEPELVKELKYEGQYNNARLIGSQIYLVSTFYPEYRDYPTPLIFEDKIQSEVPVQNIHYFNIPYSNPSLVVVNSINLETETTTDSEAITVEGYPNIYMSEDNMFVVYTEYINEWELEQQIMIEKIVPKLSAEDQEYIQRIKNTDSDILSRYEKQAKILQVAQRYFSNLPEDEMDDLQDEIDTALKAKLEEYKYMEYTIINKLSVSSGEVDVEANGKVPGHILNQFSMDEYDNEFRIATTISQRWSRFMIEEVTVDAAEDTPGINEIEEGRDMGMLERSDEKMIAPPRRSDSMNNLYVLNSDLKIIGELEGLAEGEQIYSVRFMGERAYVVTFRQVDPFFVIDLSGSDPEVLGELKIPGFSRYLHPYDKNTIIGIGRDATDTGRQQGLKISLFDVSNVEKPKEIASYISDEQYASSTAEWEHKAFLFSKEKELLVIPVYSYDYRERGDDMNGALVFHITSKNITLRGLVDHGSDNGYGPSVERSLYIEELLYTKSPYLIRVNELEDLSSVANVTLSMKDTSGVKRY
ncbi:MAG: beta-propeller domain-containing protein [Candidatus Nanoarchaeia archaeon]